MRECSNCRYRYHVGWSGIECCFVYELVSTEKEEIEAAAGCSRYDEGTPDCLKEERYAPSATNGDYGPSAPWNAPGMSIRDFI